MLPLPAPPDYHGSHLRHVLPSALASLGVGGYPNLLGVPESSIAVVIMADGLGDENLARHTGHARFLASAWRNPATARVLDCGAPATTAVSLSSLGTGLTPGETGMVGYDVYAPELGRVVNQLGRWDPALDPTSWQPHPTVLEQAVQAGAGVATVSRPHFQTSALTRASLHHSGDFLGSNTMDGRFAAALEWITEQRRSGRGGCSVPLLVYLYVDEIDDAGHAAGVDSVTWRNRVENLDAAARRFTEKLVGRFGDQATVVLTADHGMIDVVESNLFDISGQAAMPRADHLLREVVTTAGDPRMVYLHTEQGAEQQVADTWAEEFGELAWVLTRNEAVTAGWFGPVREDVAPRIGDVIVAAHQDVAIHHTDRTGTDMLKMVGLHGSLTTAERKVPFLELTGRELS